MTELMNKGLIKTARRFNTMFYVNWFSVYSSVEIIALSKRDMKKLKWFAENAYKARDVYYDGKTLEFYIENTYWVVVLKGM